jgi:hypothetical protein
MILEHVISYAKCKFKEFVFPLFLMTCNIIEINSPNIITYNEYYTKVII